MKILWLSLFLHVAFGAHENFGKSHLKNSRLCHSWSCINTGLGLLDDLPPKEQYANIYKEILPAAWHHALDQALDVCYVEPHSRTYINTCPGQALMQCTVDNLIEFCPEDYLRKDDACAPVSTLSGFKYLFSQSRYINFTKSLHMERRPVWFLKNYFNKKCCNLPVLPRRYQELMNGCGIAEFMHYYEHQAQAPSTSLTDLLAAVATTEEETDPHSTERVDSNQGSAKVDSVKVVDNNDLDTNVIIKDPLQCCDMKEFINPADTSDCGFSLTWSGSKRLQFDDLAMTTTPPPTTTAKPGISSNVKVVPVACDKQNCVFRKLNIVSETGAVNTDAFMKLLDNFTSVHPTWIKAKARVATKCLRNPFRDYEGECEINKILACTLDVLSENCPHAKKHDPCKHSQSLNNGTVCQISASKYRPMNRRLFCGIPELVKHELLAECGLRSLSKVEYLPETSRKIHWWNNNKFRCYDMTPSTTCLLSKMGILNKYKYMDYFKMKDRIRSFTTGNAEWTGFNEFYMNAFSTNPHYRDQCSSPKKFLNIIDGMLMTCPMTRRKVSPECNQFFDNINNTPHLNERLHGHHAIDFPPLHNFQHIFLPSLNKHSVNSFQRIYLPGVNKNSVNPNSFHHMFLSDVHKQPASKPYYNGMILGHDLPPVQIIDLKPSTKPLIRVPVYQQIYGPFINKDPVFRSG